MAGGAFGTLVHGIWPEGTAGPGAYALVGMVAVVGATTHAPITAIVIIFELTKDYEIMLPLMISAIIATLIATRLQKGSIYTIKLLRRGVDIHAGQDVSLLRHLFVRDEMRTEVASVPPGTGLMKLLAMFAEHPGMSIFVVDEDRKLLGVITVNQSRAVLTNPAAFEAFIIAQDMMQETDFPDRQPRRHARRRDEAPLALPRRGPRGGGRPSGRRDLAGGRDSALQLRAVQTRHGFGHGLVGQPGWARAADPRRGEHEHGRDSRPVALRRQEPGQPGHSQPLPGDGPADQAPGPRWRRKWSRRSPRPTTSSSPATSC